MYFINKEIKIKITQTQHKLQIIIREIREINEKYILNKRICSIIKNRIEELIETQSAYKNVISVLKREIL